jgi:hypothetical protein
MPPRLRASDYAKGKISQDEIIALQIANDANIAKARKALKMGEIQQPTPAQVASPDELIADVASQEASARSNLERLGFRPQEAAQIVTNIRIDPTLDFASLNANFPAIEADIRKRFNVKLLTPTFFLDYFRKYSQELEGTTGMKVFDTGVNGLVNTIGELRSILPTREQFIRLIQRTEQIRRQTRQGTLLDPIMNRLNALEQSIPSEVDYNRIEQLNVVERERIIDEIVRATQDLPSRDQVENAIRGNTEAIQNIANSIPDGLGRRLDNIMKEVKDVGVIQDEILRRQEQSANRGSTSSSKKSEWDGQVILDLDDFSNLNLRGKREFLKSRVDIEGIFDTAGTQLSKGDIDKLFTDNLFILFEVWLPTYSSKPSGSASTAETASTATGTTQSGVAGVFREGQPKKGKGIIPKIQSSASLRRMKVGKGLAVKETPSYREYGKYAIHIPQLEQQDILNVKYKSLGQIPKFKPIPVSDIFRDFILDLLENGKPNARVYTQIAPEERKFFEEMSIGAGVWNGLGLKRTTTSTDEEENKRFEILRGEYMAGNNNPKVISELRRLVVKMMNDGRIRKNQGVQLLMELSI